MSKQATPPRKRGAPKKRTTKVRKNISIDPSVYKRAQKFAFSEGASVSSWLERLVRENTQEEGAK